MKYQDPNGVWKLDPLGNVFRPVPGDAAPLPIAYNYGPEPIGKKAAGVSQKLPMWTCPVCAIPPGVFELLQLFHECRLFKLPPVQGGLLDQPIMVRRSFPVFEMEMAKVRATEEAMRAQHAAMATGSVLVSAIFGKGK